MLDQQRLGSQPEEKREELFTQRYERLLAWALRLTNQHRASAEDLVQDAFIQFSLGRTSLEEIENIDGYLRRMLRYMHLARMSRNSQQANDRTLSIADYDSFHLSWRAIEPPQRMQAQEELHQICAYACSRKETSRAGDVLILRFFHDYYPSEIAHVLGSTRHSVDEWQRVARREVKLLLTNPGRLRFAPPKASTEQLQAKHLLADCDLISELRQMIFRSRQGDCIAIGQLRNFYQPGNAQALTTKNLGHVVSCRSCLDQVNRILGLPLLAERYQADPCGRSSPPHDQSGGGVSGGGETDLKTKYGQRLREVGEHKPQELRIAVNGSLVSSLKVSSDLSELELNLTLEEKVEFVEVFSEQGVQLLFFSASQAVVAEPDQWAWIELSEGRTLEACLRFEKGPSLHVIYKEPVIAEAQNPSTLKLVREEPLSSPLSGGEPSKVMAHELGDANSRLRFGRLFRFLKLRIQAAMARHEGSLHSTAETSAPAVTKGDPTENVNESGVLSLLGRASQGIRNPIWARPGFLTFVVVLAVAIGAFLYFKAGSAPTLTAANLLERASLAEDMSDKIPDQVTHRLINLEERRSAEGALVSRRKIEVWQNSTRGDRAQRLYDESNKIIAGAWQKADGSRTVYHHGAKSRPQPAPVTTNNLLLNLDDVWQLEPSAKEFNTLIAGSADAQLEERSTSYVITSEKERAIGASRLLKATLTLSRSDLHPIEQTLLVERAGDVREYRFVEASFERLPQKDVAPAVFAPEPELLGRDATRSRGNDGKLTSPSPSLPVSPSLLVASAELEVDVAYLLNQAKGDRGEQVTLTRSASGSLRVEGIVDSQQRKEELLSALAPVSKNPAVKIEIDTVTEAMQRQTRSSSGTVTIREAEDTANTVAVDHELRDYLSRRDPALQSGNGLDEAVRSFSSRIVNRAYRALFHAIELKRLVNRFANVDMRTLTPDARAKWLEMLREHAAAFGNETAVLRQEIQPIFFSSESLNLADEFTIANHADLASAVERLHKLALFNNEAIRAAFTISSQSSAAPIKSSQFWHSLTAAKKLAAQIKRYGI